MPLRFPFRRTRPICNPGKPLSQPIPSPRRLGPLPEYGVYTKKARFLARSMKTKALFWRYPLKYPF
jgi:hypothetical protein